MKNQEFNCQQAISKIDEYRRAGIKEIDDSASGENLLEHLSACPDCLREASKSIDIESLLSQAFAKAIGSKAIGSKAIGSKAIGASQQASIETSTPMQFLRTRVEARIVAGTSIAKKPIRNTIMSSIFNQLKNRSRLSLGVAFAVTALMAATLIPFKYDSEIGYEVAFAGVNKDLALDGDKITALLHELGVQGAIVDVSGCEATCNLKITDLKSLEDGRLLIAAFESGGAVHLTNGLTPVVETVSGNFLTKAHREFFFRSSGKTSTDESIHNVIIERLGDDHEQKIAAFFGVICDDSTKFSIELSESSDGHQWVEDDGSGNRALMLFHAEGHGDSLTLHQTLNNGNVSIGSHGVMNKIICLDGSDSLCNIRIDGLADFDLKGGQLTAEQIAKLEASGYTVTISEGADGQQRIELRRASESGASGAKIFEFISDGSNLAKETPGGFPDSPDDPSALPKGFSLSQNYPNPFNPNTKIDYTIAAPERVQIDIINVMGQTVKTLVDEQVGAGTHTVEWDATDDSGRQVASGMYFYRLKAGNIHQTKKMTLLK